MPELPEVETLCRQLQKKICGRMILATEIYDKKLDGIKNIKTGRIISVERQGKTIIISLDHGDSIKIHLRMTGRLFWQKRSDIPPYSRLSFSFDDGRVFLVDPRRFATVKVERTKTEKVRNDLMTDFDEKDFLKKRACRKMNIKTLLMDPKAIAGIGNIYACEILHRSKISPFRQGSALSGKEWKKIFAAAGRILTKGIEKRGTSISDWRDLYGQKGENQRELKVYGREGEKCTMCGRIICRIKQGGRSTFYCPACQR